MNIADLMRTGLVIIYTDTDSLWVAAKYRRHKGWLARVMTDKTLEEFSNQWNIASYFMESLMK